MLIPLSVPQESCKTYEENYQAITRGKDRLMLFAGDQKIEHLNEDFHGAGISDEDNNPRHLFEIASTANIGVFATQLGLASRLGHEYKEVNYLIKLNSKTNFVPTSQRDPQSMQLWSIHDVVRFQETSGLNIRAVGYTLYLGSEHEAQMLTQAAQIVFQAHQVGLVAVLWIYPRGKAVSEEKSGDVIAGAAGVGAALGADFAKVIMPMKSGKPSYEELAIAAEAAGNTKLIISGGSAKDPRGFVTELYDQIHTGNAAGSATGRNLHQRSLPEAVALSNAMAAIVYEEKTLAEALSFLK
jgi:fructose-bisphosphate aldolase/6-deoxy-5-ketofructose 1-phosphate synthase